MVEGERFGAERRDIRPKLREIQDDFVGEKLADIWEAKRVEPGRFEAGKFYGRNAIAITIHPGDKAGIGRKGEKTERAEITEAADIQLPVDVLVSYKISLLIPEHESEIDRPMIVAQWKQAPSKQKEQPPFAWRYGSGKLRFTIKDGNQEEKVASEKISVQFGVWYDLEVKFCVGQDHTGRCEAYVNGEKVMDYAGHIGYDHQPAVMYFKFGPYRGQQIYPDTVFYSQFKRSLLLDNE